MTYFINKSRDESELPKLTKECFNLLINRFGSNLKITDLPELLKTVTTNDEFEDINYMYEWTPEFVSYLIDLQRDYMAGKDLDLGILHQDLVKVFHLSKAKRQNLVDNNFEERLWAIFFAITNPFHKIFEIND